MQLDLKNYAKKGFFLQSKGFVDNNGWYSSGFSNLCSVNIYLFKANNDAGDKFTLIVPPPLVIRLYLLKVLTHYTIMKIAVS